MRIPRLALLALGLLCAVNAANSNTKKELVSEYVHVPTSCDTENCVAGGCLFENCASPLSCKGGLCYFRYVLYTLDARSLAVPLSVRRRAT